MTVVSESRKAIVAFVVAFLGPIGGLLATNVPLDARSWGAAAAFGVAAGLATYLTPNAPKAPDA
jgi:hypothetical protein